MEDLVSIDVYSGKRVLVTGHTGFKGSWLSIWLHQLGAEVHGVGLAPDTEPSLFEAAKVENLCKSSAIFDVRDGERMAKHVTEVSPEVVLHLAAQPLVRLSYAEPTMTFETNIVGTMNVLEAVRRAGKPTALVVVTTDKVYLNREWDLAYREEDPLGGYDPYSASKAAAEIVVSSYRQSFFHPAKHAEHGVGVATARAGNVIGGGDWALDRIIPDCVRALGAGKPIDVRNPNATRPWQHVLEPLAGYLTLGAKLLGSDATSYTRAYNFGPPAERPLDVRGVVETAIEAWGSGEWADRSDGNAPHEAGKLRLAIDRAAADLGWLPRWGSPEAVRRSIAWYRGFQDRDALSLCRADIADYGAL